MDSMPGQGLNGQNDSQNINSPDDIDLGGYEQWKIDPSLWELEEEERDQHRDTDVSVRYWLQGQDNSQPAQDTYINSRSRHQRQRKTQEVLVLVDDVLAGNTRPSSIQATTSSNDTTPSPRNPTTSNIITTSNNEQLLNRSTIPLLSLQQFPTALDRNARYCDNGYHDKRVSGTLASQNHQAFPIASNVPQVRGHHGQPIGLPLVRGSRSVAGTDTSASSKKPPKRQNSRSTDDETSSKRTFSRWNKSGVNSQLHRPLSPSSSVPAKTTAPDGSSLLQTPVEGAQGPRNRVRNNTSSLVSESTSLTGTQQGRSLPSSTGKMLSYKDFENVCETCPFWLYDPARFSNVERQACYGPKEEVSHIVTHLADHHGLVRGKDPKNTSRKYLSSCQSHDPSIKTKGDCLKCSSLHKWEDSDFTDREHKGVVLCLRCWFKFDKKEMQCHLAGPMCSYNAEQPKPKKMCILYTTFCSHDKPPSSPPTNVPPRRAKLRSPSRKRNRRKEAQQVDSTPNRRPAPKQASQILRPPRPQPPYNQGQSNLNHQPPSPVPSQNQSSLKGNMPVSHEFDRSQTRQSVSGGSFTRQGVDIQQQPNRQPIAIIFPDTQPEQIVDLGYKMMQRDMQQGVPQSTYSSMVPPTSFGNLPIDGTMINNGFQQPQSGLQNGLRLPNEYQDWSPFFQVPQQSSANANLSTYNDRSRQLLRPPNASQLPFQTSPRNDLDATISFPSRLSQAPSSPSRVPSTAGESMGLLQSPNIDEPMWLSNDYEYDDSQDWLFDTVGSHLQLQEHIDVTGPPPFQPQQRHEDLDPDSPLPAVHDAAIEKDSGYESHSFDDMDWDANKIFSPRFS